MKWIQFIELYYYKLPLLYFVAPYLIPGLILKEIIILAARL